MAQLDVKQIRVDNCRVGIIGLSQTIEAVADECRAMADDEIKSELLNRFSKKNYIPENVKESYGTAFLREYKKFSGQPYEEETYAGLEIKVLGPGCAQCDRLERELIEIMSELNIRGDIEHVRDAKKIASYRLLGQPALIINGEVKAMGSVPPRHKMITWLKGVGGY